MTGWLWWLVSATTLLSTIPTPASGSDCMTELIRLSGVPSNNQNKTIEIFRDNQVGQNFLYQVDNFGDANTFLDLIGVKSISDRFSLFRCLNRDADSGSPCKRLSPCGGGMCCIQDGRFVCECPPGFTGPNCRHELNECELQRPCLNGATCVDHVNNYTCTCAPGFYGRRCETDHNECVSGPCSHGSCIDVVNGYECDCHHGYGGVLCDEDIKECLSSPCQHGKCHDHVGKYSCHCHRGYNGTNCDVDIDECASGPCQNKGTCQDHVNNYTCHCSVGYDGRHCENLWLSKETFARMEEKLDDNLRREMAGIDASSKVKFARMEEKHTRMEEKLQLEIADLKSSTSTSYIRWGRSECPATATLVYSGRAGGAHRVNKGGGVDTLCMPDIPIYGRHADYTWGDAIYGAGYDNQGQNVPFPSSLNGKTIPCALCLATNASTSTLIPARNVCPSEWRLEYHGYLQASHYSSQYRTRYLCFDDQSEGYSDGGSLGPFFYRVAVDSGRGLQSSYIHARELTCAICSK